MQHATEMNSEPEESVGNNNFGRNPALYLPFAALDFVTRLATGIFSRGRKNVDPDFSDSKGENEFQSRRMTCISEEGDSSDESSALKSNVIDNCGMQSTRGKGEEHAAVEAPVSSNASEASSVLRTEKSDTPTCSEDNNCNFKRFDITKDPLDHHFLGSNGQVYIARLPFI